MPLALNAHICCPPEVLSRVLDGEAVLLHLGTGTYFGMNEVATRAWEVIAQGATVEQIADTLEREFEVERAVLLADLQELLQSLVDKDLVTVTPGAAASPAK